MLTIDDLWYYLNMICPYCRNEIPDGVDECIVCGKPASAGEHSNLENDNRPDDSTMTPDPDDRENRFCPTCGNEIPDDREECDFCANPETSEDSPEESRTESTPAYTLIFKTFWLRCFAAVIDTIIIFIFYFGINHIRKQISSIFPISVLFLIPTLISFLYFTLLTGKAGKGQTVGKKLMGLRVVSQNGEIISYGKSFLRYFVECDFCISIVVAFLTIFHPINNVFIFRGLNALCNVLLFSLVFFDIILILFHPFRTLIHDILAGTYVVRTKYESLMNPEYLLQVKEDYYFDVKVKKIFITCAIIGVIILGIWIRYEAKNRYANDLFFIRVKTYEKFNTPIKDGYVTSDRTKTKMSNKTLALTIYSKGASDEKRIKPVLEYISELCEKRKLLKDTNEIKMSFFHPLVSYPGHSDETPIVYYRVRNKACSSYKECLNKGSAAQDKKDYERAIDYFSNALNRATEKQSSEIYVLRGKAYFEAGEFKKAIMNFKTAIFYDSQNASAYYERGLAYKKMPFLAKFAARDFEKAERLDPAGKVGDMAREELKK
ncbi:MAG TPA: RDD family protein [bacterium]|nr:RDD family protein [bacterium]